MKKPLSRKTIKPYAKKVYGRSSEKNSYVDYENNPFQLSLFTEEEPKDVKVQIEEKNAKKKFVPRRKTGYKAAQLKNMEKQTIVHTLSESEKRCEKCSGEMKTIFHLDNSFSELTNEQRKVMRIEKIKPLLDDWYKGLENYRTKKANSKFEKAVNYAFNQREVVYRIFEDGALELTNNRAERAVKEIVTGRKNWLFSKNGKGARANAIYQSHIMTAEVNGLSPWKYLEWLLTEIKELEATTEEDFARYLPWSEKAQEKCKIGSICTDKYQHYFKK